MVKYYYENLLSNQNLTAKTNIAWVADITTLRLFRDQKAYVFLCIEIHTNYIVASLISVGRRLLDKVSFLKITGMYTILVLILFILTNKKYILGTYRVIAVVT